MKRILILIGLMANLTAQNAQAQNFDFGKWAGRVIGGVGGFVLGKEACGRLFDGARPENRGFAQGLCAVGGAVAGGLILGELLKSGNDEDVNQYMGAHRQAYTGPIGQRVELNAGGYHGGFTPMRQYRHRDSRQICRVIRYEAYDLQGRPVYRSQIRNNQNRLVTVNYVEKFECRLKDNQWAERPFSASVYVLYNPQQNNHFNQHNGPGYRPPVGGPGFGPGPGGFNPQGQWGSRVR